MTRRACFRTPTAASAALLAIFCFAVGVACQPHSEATDIPAGGVPTPGEPHGPLPEHALLAGQLPVARVVVLGDSISEGLGARRREFSYAGLLMRNDDVRYPAQAGEDLTHRYGQSLRYINVAHAGDTSDKVVAEQLPRLRANALDDVMGLGSAPVRGHTVVFLTVGGNDLRGVMVGKAGYDGAVLQNALANLECIFAFFGDGERFPDGVTLYFANIYDVTDGTDSAHTCLQGFVFPGLTAGLDGWSAAYRALAQASYGSTLRVHLLDVLTLFHGHGFHYADVQNPYFRPQDASLWLSDRDCIHPNHRGHHELRRGFWRLFNQAPPLPR